MKKITTFSEYEAFTNTTAKFPTGGNYPVVYTALGLNGEAGEYAEKVKKILRDKDGEISDEYRTAMIKELGDVAWYLAQSAKAIGSSLEEVVQLNVEKLTKRLQDNKIKGEGDDR